MLLEQLRYFAGLTTQTHGGEELSVPFVLGEIPDANEIGVHVQI
jgi:hypothetical protein